MLPGIRQCCRWSKLQRVSPCWTASNPPPPHPHACGRGRDWCSAQGQSASLHDPAERWTFHWLCLWRTAPTPTTLPEVSGEESACLTDSRRAGLPPLRQAKPLPFPAPFPNSLSQNVPADRQQWHISMTLFSLDLAAYHKAMRISVACPSVSLSLVSTHSTD